MLHNLCFQAVPQLPWFDDIVLNGVTWAHEGCLLQAGNAVQHFELNLFGHGGGEVADVVFSGVPAFWLEENLVARLIGETHHLILDGWAVARTNPFNHTGEHRRTAEVLANDVVGVLVGVGHPAGELILKVGAVRRREAEVVRRLVARLLFSLCKINRVTVHAWWRPRLETAQLEAEMFQVLGQLDAWQGVVGATTVHELADDNFAATASTGGQNNGPRVVARTR